MSRKEALHQLRATLIRRREGLRRAMAAELDELANAPVVGDLADTALDCERDEVCSQLSANASRELGQVESAVSRMRKGRYGVCEGCGKKIPVVRLQALPYATHCIDCQRNADLSNELWTVRPELAGAFGDEEFATRIDVANM